MELILKTNNENSIAKIIALAKKLNVVIEKNNTIVEDKIETETLKNRILNFKAKGPSPFGDATEWQHSERKDRDLPFPQ